MITMLIMFNLVLMAFLGSISCIHDDDGENNDNDDDYDDDGDDDDGDLPDALFEVVLLLLQLLDPLLVAHLHPDHHRVVVMIIII